MRRWSVDKCLQVAVACVRVQTLYWHSLAELENPQKLDPGETVTNPRFKLGTPQLCFSSITAVRTCLAIEVTLQKFNVTQFIKSEFEENSCNLCALNPLSITPSVVSSLVQGCMGRLY